MGYWGTSKMGSSGGGRENFSGVGVLMEWEMVVVGEIIGVLE